MIRRQPLKNYGSSIAHTFVHNATQFVQSVQSGLHVQGWLGGTSPPLGGIVSAPPFIISDSFCDNFKESKN